MGCKSGGGSCCASVTRASSATLVCSRVGARGAPWRRPNLKRVVWTKARAVESAGQGAPTGALEVRSKEPIRSAGIAAGRQDVIPEAAIADRHFGPGVEIGAAPRDHDDLVVTSAVGNDCRGRLDDGAAGGALDHWLRRG